jgi:hypothetical protein
VHVQLRNKKLLKEGNYFAGGYKVQKWKILGWGIAVIL